LSGGLAQADRDFRAALDAFGDEVRSCATVVYTELAFHFCAGSDHDLLDRVRLHPAFWNAVNGGLQSAGFIALGRIYEDKAQPGAARNVLQIADRNVGLFRHAALAKRKMADGLSEADAKVYAAAAHEVRTALS
jgi:hypothetical protein